VQGLPLDTDQINLSLIHFKRAINSPHILSWAVLAENTILLVDQSGLTGFGYKKESPDVETPGLLVKALISSYFMMIR
jgi:hypothetical protein